MKIEFTTGNAAFDEECGGSLEYETIRILREICGKIEIGYIEGSIIGSYENIYLQCCRTVD